MYIAQLPTSAVAEKIGIKYNSKLIERPLNASQVVKKTRYVHYAQR